MVKGMSDPPIFKCKTCEKPYPAVLIQHGQNLSTEKRNELRKVWHAAIDRLWVRLDNPNATYGQIKSAEEYERETGFDYLNTIQSQSWGVSEELFSKGNQLFCPTCVPKRN
jgi:hypothetical protein